jgi:hypothetical protein
MVTVRNLAEQILNEGELYPQLLGLYRKLAPLVSDEEKVWRHFSWKFRPVVEAHLPTFYDRYDSYYEREPGKTREYLLMGNENAEERLIQGAYNYIAHRFVEECRLNPQDFGLAAS